MLFRHTFIKIKMLFRHTFIKKSRDNTALSDYDIFSAIRMFPEDKRKKFAESFYICG